MREWTIGTAIKHLEGDKVAIGEKYLLIPKEGLKGLKSCSAYDYLKKIIQGRVEK